jgi:hypothetical protein
LVDQQAALAVVADMLPDQPDHQSMSDAEKQCCADVDLHREWLLQTLAAHTADPVVVERAIYCLRRAMSRSLSDLASALVPLVPELLGVHCGGVGTGSASGTVTTLSVKALWQCLMALSAIAFRAYTPTLLTIVEPVAEAVGAFGTRRDTTAGPMIVALGMEVLRNMAFVVENRDPLLAHAPLAIDLLQRRAAQRSVAEACLAFLRNLTAGEAGARQLAPMVPLVHDVLDIHGDDNGPLALLALGCLRNLAVTLDNAEMVMSALPRALAILAIHARNGEVVEEGLALFWNLTCVPDTSILLTSILGPLLAALAAHGRARPGIVGAAAGCLRNLSAHAPPNTNRARLAAAGASRALVVALIPHATSIPADVVLTAAAHMHRMEEDDLLAVQFNSQQDVQLVVEAVGTIGQAHLRVMPLLLQLLQGLVPGVEDVDAVLPGVVALASVPALRVRTVQSALEHVMEALMVREVGGVFTWQLEA